MRTLDEQSSPKDSIWQRARRNVRLAIRIARMVLAYLTTGRRVRRAYRDKEARGDVFWLDGDLP